MASPLSDFVKIGPRTSLYTPTSSKSGQLIILCTWLGAGRKHIAKFTSLYQRTAPSARILLIQSSVPILISSYAHQRKEIQSAVSAVLDTLSGSSEEPSMTEGITTDEVQNRKQKPKPSRISPGSTPGGTLPKILLHTFSNGGTNTATQLLITLRERLHTPLPLTGLLCDSGPAKETYWKSYNATVLSLPKDLPSQILGPLACHCILIILFAWIACGNEPPADLMRRTLLESENVEPGWESGGEYSSAGRVCYLFSKEDRMCHWEDVRDHAEEARVLGWQTQEVVFDGSGHCAHLPKNELEYAEAVKGVWEGIGVWE